MSLAIYIGALAAAKKGTDDTRGAIEDLADTIESSPTVLKMRKLLDSLGAQIEKIEYRLSHDPAIVAARENVEKIGDEADKVRADIEADPFIRQLTAQLDELAKKRDALQAQNEPSLELRERELKVRDAEERLKEIRDALKTATIDETNVLNAERDKLLAELPALRESAKALAKEEESRHLSAERLAIEQEKIAIAAEKLQADLDARQKIADEQIARAEARQKAAEDKLAALTAAGEKKLDELRKKEEDLQRKVDDLEREATAKAEGKTEESDDRVTGFFGHMAATAAKTAAEVKTHTDAIGEVTSSAVTRTEADMTGLVSTVTDATARAQEALAALLNREDARSENIDVASLLPRADQQKYAREISGGQFAYILDDIASIFAELAKSQQQTPEVIARNQRLERSLATSEQLLRRFAGPAGQKIDFNGLRTEIQKLVRAQEAAARNAARNTPRSGKAGKDAVPSGCQPADSLTTLVTSGALR